MYQQIILIGNVGNDPEMRYTASGTPVSAFRMAVSKHWTSADGQKQEKTVWFRITAWQKLAEFVAAGYIVKGRQVMVMGEMEEANAYVNKAGDPAASLEVTAKEIKLLGSKPQEEGAPAYQAPGRQAPAVKAQARDEDIPF